MSDRVPTDDDIREESVAYLSTEDYDPNPEPMAEDAARSRFNSWLAEHDAALIEELADEATAINDDFHHYLWGYGTVAARWLREKARQRREDQA